METNIFILNIYNFVIKCKYLYIKSQIELCFQLKECSYLHTSGMYYFCVATFAGCIA